MLPQLPKESLLRGLRNLRDESLFFGAPADAAESRAVQSSISSFGWRANERFLEVNEELEFMEKDKDKGKSRSRHRHTETGITEEHSQTEVKECEAKFHEIIKGINNVMTGAGNQPTTLRPNEEVNEIVKNSTQKYFRVPLPNRPMQITVTVLKLSGSDIEVYGSTVHEKPSARHCEYKAKDLIIVYQHVVKFDDDDAGDIDRTKAVPKAKDLFVCVEGSKGETQFRVSFALGQAQIVLTRSELAKRIKSIRGGWEARVDELRREPSARDDFMDHVHELQKRNLMRRKMEASGKDFQSINKIETPSKCTPRGRFLQIRSSAMKRYQKADAVKVQKKELEDQDVARREWWLHKDEIRREERRREAEEALEVSQRDDRRRAWLQYLCMVAMIENIHRAYVAEKEYRRQVAMELQSAQIIQRWCLTKISHSRKQRMYRNVIRLRLGMAVFVRHSRHSTVALCAPALKWFLKVHAFHHEVPTMKGILAQFRGKVLLVQKFWMRLKSMRKARVEVMESAWNSVGVDVIRSLTKEEKDKKKTVQKRKTRDLSEAADSTSLLTPMPPEGSSPNPKRKSVRKNSSKPMPDYASAEPAAEPDAEPPPEISVQTPRKSVLARRQSNLGQGGGTFLTATPHEEEEVPQIPNYIRSAVLMENVVSQQKTYQQRMEVWAKQQKELAEEVDMERFTGTGQAGKKAKKPQPFSVDHNELKALIRSTFVDWNEGKFKHIEKNRERIMKKAWKTWVRALGYYEDPPASRGPSPSLDKRH